MYCVKYRSKEQNHLQEAQDKWHDVKKLKLENEVLLNIDEYAFSYLLELNNQIRRVLSVECGRLDIPLEQISNFGKTIKFLNLNDYEALQLRPLYLYKKYIDDICNGFHDQMSNFIDDSYGRFIYGRIPFESNIENLLWLGSSNRLEQAIEVTTENWITIKSLFSRNEIKTDMEVAEFKKFQIFTTLIELSAYVIQSQLGASKSLDTTQIKDKFLTKIENMAGDLINHVQGKMKFDDIVEKINDCIQTIIIVQKGIPLELILSLLV